MVDYSASVFTRSDSNSGMQGIEVIITDSSGEAIESIQVTNQTQFNALVERLDDLDITYPAFDNNSPLSGRTIDNLLANLNEDVNINATTLGGFESDKFSKSTHNHDERYFTEDEVNSKLALKSDASHTHSNWEKKWSNTYASLYVNTNLRMCILKYYRENYTGFKESSYIYRQYKTLATIPEGYRPRFGVHTDMNNMFTWGTVDTYGDVMVASEEYRNSLTLNFEAMWIY